MANPKSKQRRKILVFAAIAVVLAGLTAFAARSLPNGADQSDVIDIRFGFAKGAFHRQEVRQLDIGFAGWGIRGRHVDALRDRAFERN